ncbi:MAG: 2,3-bisphosphoglycerate-independent phosphoglycerate mutase [Patescibacteria group bacterium]
MARPKPVVLLVLDGFGVAPPNDGNAIAQAKLPNFRKIVSTYPALVIQSSSQDVGLQFGEMGNSEVGHLTIGAGRVLYQNLPRINRSIEDGSFLTNEAFIKTAAHVQRHNSQLHLIGLVSPAGVHAHLDHLIALLNLAHRQKLKRVYIHAILDGRDTLPHVADDFIVTLQKAIKKSKVGAIASLSGRWSAMDRDNNWSRTEAAYRAMAEGVSEQTASDPLVAIAESYKHQVYDEEFEPTVITKNDQPLTTIQAGDGVIFFNFRADRARQLTKAFVLPSFNKFKRPDIADLFFTTMMEYEQDLPVSAVAFPPEEVVHPLAEVIAQAGLKQLHLAETEKYAHVTFFFNGLKDICYPGETQIVIPSPKVASYAEQPAMSAEKITSRLIQELKPDTYDFVVVNFANPDMVAHTGNLAATIKGLEVLDQCLGQIVDVVLAKDGVVFITADHGNAEEMIDLQTGEILKDHSTNPVPFIAVRRELEGQTAGRPEASGGDLSIIAPSGILSDVAPTVLKALELDLPAEMTGSPLL